MRRHSATIPAGCMVLAAASCASVDLSTLGPGHPAILPVETRFAFTNLSTKAYAALAIRAHGDTDYATLPLLPPGGTYRGDFSLLLDHACPGSLDVRLLLYRRVNTSIPIGLDAGETVASEPFAGGEILDVPACDVEPVEVYTIVNWDAPEGTARLKFAQDTPVDAWIRQSGRFPNADAAWQTVGVDPGLAALRPPEPAWNAAITGRVVDRDGTGIENIGVLLRTRWRARLDDADAGNDPDSGYSDPIAVTRTDAFGCFSLDRPPGAYRVEVFQDGYLFRPDVIDVETPLDSIVFVAEPQ
ncbi:MAG TPA: carboxypeptidase-like regulatory domain-containing protein [Phycisphaerae bacterium]|nr:carboxypeptidase-like regulatory domain-containing protein [Phycisphaerae bacterium]HRY71006.1 carboxypeptidase-like regulatory domain-containing protein [Phycisphaerae bacterium]HSA29298.1 carboxypeptidase-like regulatory domain-containing protein [Phycisphaerae bacterium]